MYIHCLSKSYWRDSTHLCNGYDVPVHFDFDYHTFESQDVGMITYRLLPKKEEEFERVFIELSYADEEVATRGSVLRLHYYVDHQLFEERDDPTGPYFSKGASTFMHRLGNYEWEDDYFVRCKIDERVIFMDDDDFRKETFLFEEIGDVTYRILPKRKDTNKVVVELSWYDDPPALWDSIYKLYDIMDDIL